MIPKPKMKAKKRRRISRLPRGHRKTKSELKRLEDEVWRLQSKMVRLRDKKCVQCGATEKLTQGHIISTKMAATRYDWLNVHCQCSTCNYRHQFSPDLYQAWFVGKYGGSAFVELSQKAHQPHKFTKDELERLKMGFELLIESLEKIANLHDDRDSLDSSHVSTD